MRSKRERGRGGEGERGEGQMGEGDSNYDTSDVLTNAIRNCKPNLAFLFIR